MSKSLSLAIENNKKMIEELENINKALSSDLEKYIDSEAITINFSKLNHSYHYALREFHRVFYTHFLDQGLTQQQIANKVKLTRNTVNNHINGSCEDAKFLNNKIRGLKKLNDRDKEEVIDKMEKAGINVARTWDGLYVITSRGKREKITFDGER